MTCDFCTSPIPAWLFMVPKGVHAIQRKAWTACDRCAILIQNNDRASLAKRIAKISNGSSAGMSSADLELFFRNRCRESPVRILRFELKYVRAS